MVLKPEKEQEAEAIFRKWGLDFAVVGYTTPSKRFVVKHGDNVMADLPIKELGDEAPLYDRPHVATEPLEVIHARDVAPPISIPDALEKIWCHAAGRFGPALVITAERFLTNEIHLLESTHVAPEPGTVDRY